MKITSGFLFVGSLALVGSLVALTACGDDSSTGSTSTTSTSTTAGSGGGGTGGGGTGGGGTGGSAVTPELTCEYYCKSIDGAAGACKDANDQYSDTLADDCMSVCKNFDKGDLKDTMGDTLGCRIYHASVAAMSSDNANTHCPHAGPFGEGQCGASCDDFCKLAMSVCTGPLAQWGDMAACMTDCATFPNTMPTEKYSVTNSAGNSFGCRAYHLTAAAIDAGTHCGHIGKDSPVCK